MGEGAKYMKTQNVYEFILFLIFLASIYGMLCL
jgi:hypothetical protein